MTKFSWIDENNPPLMRRQYSRPKRLIYSGDTLFLIHKADADICHRHSQFVFKNNDGFKEIEIARER